MECLACTYLELRWRLVCGRSFSSLSRVAAVPWEVWSPWEIAGGCFGYAALWLANMVEVWGATAPVLVVVIEIIPTQWWRRCCTWISFCLKPITADNTQQVSTANSPRIAAVMKPATPTLHLIRRDVKEVKRPYSILKKANNFGVEHIYSFRTLAILQCFPHVVCFWLCQY